MRVDAHQQTGDRGLKNKVKIFLHNLYNSYINLVSLESLIKVVNEVLLGSWLQETQIAHTNVTI